MTVEFRVDDFDQIMRVGGDDFAGDNNPFLIGGGPDDVAL